MPRNERRTDLSSRMPMKQQKGSLTMWSVIPSELVRKWFTQVITGEFWTFETRWRLDYCHSEKQGAPSAKATEETFGNCETAKRQRLLYFKKWAIMRAVDIIQKKEMVLPLETRKKSMAGWGYGWTVPDYQMPALLCMFILKWHTEEISCF